MSYMVMSATALMWVSVPHLFNNNNNKKKKNDACADNS